MSKVFNSLMKLPIEYFIILLIALSLLNIAMGIYSFILVNSLFMNTFGFIYISYWAFVCVRYTLELYSMKDSK